MTLYIEGQVFDGECWRNIEHLTDEEISQIYETSQSSVIWNGIDWVANHISSEQEELNRMFDIINDTSLENQENIIRELRCEFPELFL